MNNQLIKKIITSNNLPCPEFAFVNPLLDKNVVEALSKSFVKILKLSQQNSNINNNMRLSILEIIRKMCQVEPENHLRVDENISTLITEVYEQKIKGMESNVNNTTNKDLDAFLIRQLKDMNINSSYESSLNPEVIQALNNLNANEFCRYKVVKDLIHWNNSDYRNVHILKDLWTTGTFITEDISVKLKAEIETILLEVCNTILTKTDLNIEELFVSSKSLDNIVKRSSDSANCFQICCSILHYLFVMTNFNARIQMFVQTFVSHVKQSCPHLSFSILYPPYISNVALLLDIDLEEMPTSIQNNYIELAIKYLSELQLESESDLIMILSHFPKWFSIYFDKKNIV